jgi:RNA polymerase sigma-70 factor (ECF subfamily)
MRAGLPAGDVEDMIQDVLLAIHTKRQTWDTSARLGPWVHAIVRHKVIDGFRRRGRRDEIPIDDVIEILPAETPSPEPAARDLVERYVQVLRGKQYEVVKAISLDHASIRQTAERLEMSEGAVRVTLHRGIAALARAFRENAP